MIGLVPLCASTSIDHLPFLTSSRSSWFYICHIPVKVQSSTLYKTFLVWSFGFPSTPYTTDRVLVEVVADGRLRWLTNSRQFPHGPHCYQTKDPKLQHHRRINPKGMSVCAHYLHLHLLCRYSPNISKLQLMSWLGMTDFTFKSIFSCFLKTTIFNFCLLLL